MYIDKDKLKQQIIKCCNPYGSSEKITKDEVYKTALTCIECATEEDVIPVKHGKWIIESRERAIVVCSECNAGCFTKSRYCPNCGAKMDL